MASPDKTLHLNMPQMPPPMHSRAGSDLGERPLTPTSPRHQHAQPFISPAQTPQGSPSKNRMPPGAFDLPDVFSNAMKLLPTLGSPNKTPRNQDHSPTRKGNKENTPPTRAGAQQQEHVSQAAASRQNQYRSQDEQTLSRQRSVISGGLTQEELEKLQKPTVKRLANVTQLCKCDCVFFEGSRLIVQTSLTTTTTCSTTSRPVKSAPQSSTHITLLPHIPPSQNTKRTSSNI